jgi:hypothetical protein
MGDWQGIWQGPLTAAQYAEVENMVARRGYTAELAEYELRVFVRELGEEWFATARLVQPGER